MCEQKPDIQGRSFAFAVRIMKLVRALPRDIAGYTVAKQLARSGTSVGANIEEAQASHSKREFIRRMNIARSEARETWYWLRLLSETEILPQEQLRPIVDESEEIVRVMTTIVKTARKNEDAASTK